MMIGSCPVLTLSDERLEELFCPVCGMARWCHVKRLNRVQLRWVGHDGSCGSSWPMWTHYIPTPPFVNSAGVSR
jgi:hypothetical protein